MSESRRNSFDNENNQISFTEQQIADAAALEIYAHYLQHNRTLDILSAVNIMRLLVNLRQKDQSIETIFILLALKVRTLINAWIDKNPQAANQINNPRIYFGPENPDYRQHHVSGILNTLRGGIELICAETNADKIRHLTQHNATLAIEILGNSNAEISDQKLKFVTRIDEEIKRVRASAYGEDSARDNKIIGLYKLSILALNHATPEDAIDEFKQLKADDGKSYYYHFSQHRRTGCLSMFNICRPLSQQLIDSFSAPTQIDELRASLKSN